MKRWIYVVGVLLALLALAVPVWAQGGEKGKVVFGGTFTLPSGETLDGDLTAFGGEITLEKDSLVRGDMAVLGGRATVAGEVTGDVVLFGGDISLKDTARIGGQVIHFGGQVNREAGSVVRGGVTEAPFRLGLRGLRPLQGPWLSGGLRPWFGDGVRTMWGMIWGVIAAVGKAVLLALLGMVIVLFWPEPTQRVGRVLMAEPLSSLGVGLLSLVIALCVGLVLLIAACSGLLIWLATGIAWVFGWTAVGLLVGQRIVAAFKGEPTLPVAALLGVGLISLIWAFPCLGSLFALIVGSAGLGAVVLTRAGTRDYPATPVVPPLPPAPIELGGGLSVQG